MSDADVIPPTDDSVRSDPAAARSIFRYVTADEWRDYRAVIAVFADTFFAEFSPDDVAEHLRAANHTIEPALVSARLEQLRAWGNLTVSSSVGSPASIADYYRRRNRYLITPAGQEVHGLVEGVLRRVDQVRDVSTGRLRSLDDALTRLVALDIDSVDEQSLADAVRAVFDPHHAFTEEVTQFFAAINQWQARFDLTPDEFRFFAEVLVGYVGERLDEIERLARPIGRRISELGPRTGRIVERLADRGAHDLAARVDRAGLGDVVAVGRSAGASTGDWDHLESWFRTSERGASRIDRLSRDAISAIRTLTLNLTRLSRIGVGATSRRADFLRLAHRFDSATSDDECHLLAARSFGLFGPLHWGVVADDHADPVPTTTPWSESPRAHVALSLRERGDTTNRGQASPLRDRRQALELLRRRREAEREDLAAIDAELLAVGGALDGCSLSQAALHRLEQLIGRTSHGSRAGVREDGAATYERETEDETLTCRVVHSVGAKTSVSTPEGTLTLLDLDVTVVPATSGAHR